MDLVGRVLTQTSPIPYPVIPRLRPKVTFWPDFGVPKGDEIARNAPGVANRQRHVNCDQRPPHGLGASLGLPLSEWEHTQRLHRARTAQRQIVHGSMI